MPVLSVRLERHWAALTALGAIVLATVGFARWEGGSTSIPTTSPAGGPVLQAAFAQGADGTRYAAWTRQQGAVRVLEVATGQGARLRAAVPIELPGVGAVSASDPRIAAAKDSALVAFHRSTAFDTSVMALRVWRDGRVAGPFAVSTSPRTGLLLKVGVAKDGTGVIAWTDPGMGDEETSGLRDQLRAASVGVDGPRNADQLVTDDAGTGGFSLSVSPDGRAALAWATAGRPAQPGVRLDKRLSIAEAPTGGAFGSPAALPGPDGAPAFGEFATVAYTRDGALRAAWTEQVGAGQAATYALVTATRSAGNFEDRLQLAAVALPNSPYLVPLDGSELVGWERARPGGYVPKDGAWLEIAAVAGDRVLHRGSVESRNHDIGHYPGAPRLEAVESGALAIWAAEDQIAYARCSRRHLCEEQHEVVSAGRGERLELAGAGRRAIAWLEGRHATEFELRVGQLMPQNAP